MSVWRTGKGIIPLWAPFGDVSEEKMERTPEEVQVT